MADRAEREDRMPDVAVEDALFQLHARRVGIMDRVVRLEEVLTADTVQRLDATLRRRLIRHVDRLALALRLIDRRIAEEEAR